MKSIIVFILLLNVCGLYAQTKETINNKSIIDLTKAGFDSSLIASKIRTSDCKFDLSTAALIALKKEKVSPYVISMMMNKSSGGTMIIPDAKSKPQTSSSGTSAAEQTVGIKLKNGSVPEPDIINLIHFYNKSKNEIVPLERASANMRSHTKALGYGGVDMVFELPGNKSPVRIEKAEALSFIVNSGGSAADGFVLYKVDVKKNARQAVSMSVSSFEGMKGLKGVIAVNAKMLKQNIYELMPVSSLAAGEYFFANKAVTNAATSNVDVYAFGID